MTQSDYQYDMDQAERGSTVSAKTSVRGYGKHAAKSEPVDEDVRAKKWAAENRRMKQLSQASNRRLQNIKRREAEQRLKALKEQNDALEKRKKQRETYHVHNIRSQMAQKQAPRPKSRPIGSVGVDNTRKMQQRAVSAVTGINPRPRLKESKRPVLPAQPEVRLEDFLVGGCVPGSGDNIENNNLNGLDLDVRGSMQLERQKHPTESGRKEEGLIRRGGMLDSLDLQIAAFMGEQTEQKAAKPSGSSGVAEEEEKIAEEIVEEKPKEEEDWLRKSIKANAESWCCQVPPSQKTSIRKADPKTPVVPEKKPSIAAPKREETKLASRPKPAANVREELNKENYDQNPSSGRDAANEVSISTLFSAGDPRLFQQSKEISTFGWAQKDADLVENLREIEAPAEIKEKMAPLPKTTPPERPIPVSSAKEVRPSRIPQPRPTPVTAEKKRSEDEIVNFEDSAVPQVKESDVRQKKRAPPQPDMCPKVPGPTKPQGPMEIPAELVREDGLGAETSLMVQLSPEMRRAI